MSFFVSTVGYGVQYPSDVYDWNVQSGFGDIRTPDAQALFQKNYDARVRALGMEPGPVRFVQRIVTTEYGDPTDIEEPEELPVTPTIPGTPVEGTEASLTESESA